MKWELKKLGEIATFSQGIQVGLEKQLTVPKEGYVRFIRIVDYTQNTDDLRYVENPGEKYFVSEDDIVMVRYGTPGLIGRRKKGVIANNLFKIKIINNIIINDYLALFLSQYKIQNYLRTQGSATMPALNFGQLKTVDIFFPKSLEEQQNIVAKLDQAFAAIDQAKANIEKNIANAKELFQSKLNQIFSQKGEGWEIKNIRDIAIVTAGQSPEGKYYNENGVGLPFYQGKKEFTEKYIGEAKVWTEKITKEALEGDVLMSVRAPVGPINFATQKCCIGRGLASIRVKENFDKDFLFYYFKNIENQLTGNTGAVFNSINKSQIEQIQITYPDIVEQRNVVSKVNKLQEQTNLLVFKYNQKLANLEELKKSILEKAFKGELTNNNIVA
jgi:restriction endonuclease S subunit